MDWEGDGGMYVFHIDDFVKDAILASVEIMSSMILLTQQLTISARISL